MNFPNKKVKKKRHKILSELFHLASCAYFTFYFPR